ncbi:hypothetical protein JCM17846_18570 [Iodidimonas nitroreducens]|uniref:DUF1983 domain-containing protein n=2 Tax=Iodidimonas nitroreducens TaxID=1236968 RepID=A0A5A7N982_9PROT|nr:hypothetical protein JCM17846_18570 [Iodidimonas nitroreducens]
MTAGWQLARPFLGQTIVNALAPDALAYPVVISEPALAQIHDLAGAGVTAPYRIAQPDFVQVQALAPMGLVYGYSLGGALADAFFPAERYEPVRLLATAPAGAATAQVVIIAEEGIEGALRLDSFRSDVAIRNEDVDILGTTNVELIFDDIALVADGIVQLSNAVSIQNGQITALSNANIGINSQINDLQNNVSGLSTGQINLQSQVTSQGGQITALSEADIITSAQINNLQNSVSGLGNAQLSLQSQVSAQGDDLDILSDAQLSTAAQLTTLSGTVVAQGSSQIMQQTAITVIDGRVTKVETGIGLRINQDGRVIGRIDLTGTNGTANLDFEATTIRFFDGTSAKPIMQVENGKLEVCGELVVTNSIRSGAVTITAERDSTSAISLVSGGFGTWTSVPGLSASVQSDSGDVVEISTTLTPWANNAGGSAWLIAARLLRDGVPIANSGVLMEWDSIASGTISIATPFQARYGGTGGNNVLSVQVRVSAASSGNASMPPALEIRRGRMEVRRLRR